MELAAVFSGKEYHARRPARFFPFTLLENSRPEQKSRQEKPQLKRGTLVEFSGAPGSGKTQALFQFLAQNSDLKAAWLEDRLTIYPPAFSDYGIDSQRVLFVESLDVPSLIWSAQQILKSGLIQVVVLSLKDFSKFHETDFRRLQLESEKSQALTVLLSETPRKAGSWPISLQAEVRRAPELKLELVKGFGQVAHF